VARGVSSVPFRAFSPSPQVVDAGRQLPLTAEFAPAAAPVFPETPPDPVLPAPVLPEAPPDAPPDAGLPDPVLPDPVVPAPELPTPAPPDPVLPGPVPPVPDVNPGPFGFEPTGPL
jgi:hypothetical protein